MDYSELFSTFGYRALDIIFDIDTSELQETELKKLTALAIYFEKNNPNREQVVKFMEIQQNKGSLKVEKLLSLADSLNMI